MPRLGLSGTGKLLGRLEEGRLRETRLSEVRTPEVRLALDGCVMVMKSDDMNLKLRGREMSRARTHAVLPRIGPMDYMPKRSPEINITQCCAAVSAVSPLLYVSRETEGKPRRMALPETLREQMC